MEKDIRSLTESAIRAGFRVKLDPGRKSYYWCHKDQEDSKSDPMFRTIPDAWEDCCLYNGIGLDL